MREQIEQKQAQAREQVALWTQKLAQAQEQLLRWQAVEQVCGELLEEGAGDVVESE